MAETCEILREARDLIKDPDNWCGHGYGVGSGTYCAVAAIDKVTGAWGPYGCLNPGPDNRRAIETLYAFVNAPVTDEVNVRLAVGGWNDASTHDVVLAGFDKAIKAKCS